MREEASHGRNIELDDFSLQLGRRLGLRQVSSRIPSEQRELGVDLSFARGVESHGIGHAVNHLFEEPGKLQLIGPVAQVDRAAVS